MQYGLNRTARNDQFNSVSASTTRSAGSAATASQENNGSSSCGVIGRGSSTNRSSHAQYADYGTRVVAHARASPPKSSEFSRFAIRRPSAASINGRCANSGVSVAPKHRRTYN